MAMIETDMKLNVVFLLSIPFPQGMAGTKRIQHAIDGLKEQGVHSSVIITRQSATLNKPEGDYKGVPYKTLMPGLIGWRLALKLPLLIMKSKLAICRLFNPGEKNILFVYDHPSIDNIFTVLLARQLGFKIVFDIVEDADHAKESSKDIRHSIKVFFNRYLTNSITKIADGVVVISSTLENKFCKLTHGRLPLHLRPISIDTDRFISHSGTFSDQPNLFYSGSFGVKDGISELIDAFDNLAIKHSRLKLVMTGKGTDQRMKEVLERIKLSPVKNRIEYKGYVDDDKYYEILSRADIPCMTRVNSVYANAGFPFKIGEFLATGKPVVASNVSDVGKFFKDRHDAMLVKPGDSRDIVSAVEYLLANPKRAIDIGKRGRERALSLFDYRLQGIGLFKFLHAL